MAALALSLWAVYFVLALGLRVFLHSRRTGASGLVAMRHRVGSLHWNAELLEMLAIVLGVAAPILNDTVEPVAALDHTAAHAIGVGVFALGLALVVIGQHAMRESWRIGVDPGERTRLVTSGPFAHARNPIFTGVLAAQAGIALVFPSVLALAAFALLLLSVELQVRLVEEPHLTRIHGDAYTRYARDTGRFVPGLGRLRAGR